jgi:predicted glycogen debranching enzyme
MPDLDDENHVLLSSLDETVIQHGAEFNLGLHKYQGNNFSPKGHKYVREFDCEKIPATTYRVGGVVLTKEKIFVHHENRILIRYTLVDAHSATTLRFRPFLAFRSVRQYTNENSTANREYQEVENGIKTCMYAGYPELYMQFNKKNSYHFMPDWYRGIEYPKEQERGYDFREDLYVPGYFEVDIKKGESIVFSAGISEISSRQLKRMFDEEVADRTPRDSFYHCLKNSAHQFHNKQDGQHYILAGYPWFKCRARDLFVSLPGLTLAIDEFNEFESIMETARKAIYDYIDGKPSDYKIYEMDDPDVLLWAVWTLQQYAKGTSRENCRAKYGQLLEDIMDFFRKRKHNNLFLHENGLLYTNGADKPVTWMNSTTNGKPVVPRTGYIVEINALWYNAMRFVADLFREQNEPLACSLDAQAEITGASFVDVFRNEFGYLLDYVNGNMMDWSVRPNMIFTVAFDYSPLDRAQKKQVLDIVTKELLTPKGIRSLSPKSGGYNPNYVGPQIQRDHAYHQGTAWPWLMGFYLEAYLRIYKMSGVSFVERQLIGFEEEITTHCIGTISELFDGNPPFKGRGAISFAMNVGEILRILKLLSKFNSNKEEQK